jgi:hypothetical protein
MINTDALSQADKDKIFNFIKESHNTYVQALKKVRADWATITAKPRRFEITGLSVGKAGLFITYNNGRTFIKSFN